MTLIGGFSSVLEGYECLEVCPYVIKSWRGNMLWTSELDWTSLVRYRGWGCDDGNLKLAWAASCYSQSVGHKFLSPLMAVLQLVQPTSAPFNLNESLSWSKSRLSVQYYNQLKLRLWQGWGRAELGGKRGVGWGEGGRERVEGGGRKDREGKLEAR